MKRIGIAVFDLNDFDTSMDDIIGKFNKLKMEHPNKELFLDGDYVPVGYDIDDGERAKITVYYKENE